VKENKQYNGQILKNNEQIKKQYQRKIKEKLWKEGKVKDKGLQARWRRIRTTIKEMKQE
jgi:hypothetical protein